MYLMEIKIGSKGLSNLVFKFPVLVFEKQPEKKIEKKIVKKKFVNEDPTIEEGTMDNDSVFDGEQFIEDNDVVELKEINEDEEILKK